MHEANPVDARSRAKLYPAFFVTLLCTLLVSALIFTFMCLKDNRYTQNTPQAAEGLLCLEADTLEEHPVLFLIDGWELYKDELLDPVSIKTAEPDAYISIGDYKDMSFGDDSLSPHGCATYRMAIDVSGHRGDNAYTLQLPEIYSSYRLYINGELMASAGTPEPENYKPLIFTGERTFRAEEQIELIFAVSDWSHYYSGIITAPAFGDTLMVNTLVQGNLVRCAFVIGFVLMLGVIILLAGTMLERRPGVLFLLLVLCFCGYSCYSIIHALVPAGMFWYRFETFCYYAMFFLAIWIIGDLCHIHTRLSMFVKITDAAMCVLSIGVPVFFSGYHMPMHLFHLVTFYYKGFLLLYLIGSVAAAMLRGSVYAPVVLCGLSVFLSAVVVNLSFPNHDPIVFGKPEEIACLIMICFLGWAMAWSAMRRHRHSQVWHEDHYDELHTPPLPDSEHVEECEDEMPESPL